MVEIPHGVTFEERQKDLLQKKSRPSRPSRFLSSVTKGKYTDPKPLLLLLSLLFIIGLSLYLMSIFNQKKEGGRIIVPEGYKIVYPKDAPPHLAPIK